MPKQPTFEDLGGTPGIAGVRPVGTYDVDAYARGAKKIATAGEHFGASVARLGESEADFAARQAREEFNAARTQAVTGLMNQAQGLQYTGAMDALAAEEARRAADVSALGTLAGGGASLLRMYGRAYG